MFLDTFDHLLGPLDSGVLGLSAWDVDVAVLGLVPVERLDSFPSTVCICAMACHQRFPMVDEGTMGPTWSFLSCW